MEILEYKKDLLELKKRLMIALKPELEKIKLEFKDNIEDATNEINCLLTSLISVEVFNNKELNDEEYSIFCNTYYYMLYYGTIIDDIKDELCFIMNDEKQNR